MNWSEYRRTRAQDLVGRKGKLNRPIATKGGLTFAAGTVVTITGKRGGLSIEGEVCRHCKVRTYVRDADPTSIDLLP